MKEAKEEVIKEVMKPLIVCDVDNCLLNFSQGFYRFLVKNRVKPQIIQKIGFSTKYGHFSSECYAFHSPEFTLHEKKIVNDLLKSYVPIASDLDTMDSELPKLMIYLKKYFRIHLVSCAVQLPKNNRIDNLNKQGYTKGVHFDLYCTVETSEQKLEYARKHNTVALIEDKPSCLIEAVKTDIPHIFAPILKYSTHNPAIIKSRIQMFSGVSKLKFCFEKIIKKLKV